MWNTLEPPGLLSLWWGLYIASRVLGRIEVRLFDSPDTLDGFLMANYVGIAIKIVAIAAAVAAIKVIKEVSALQVRFIGMRHGIQPPT